jgi:hypothetical protein
LKSRPYGRFFYGHMYLSHLLERHDWADDATL